MTGTGDRIADHPLRAALALLAIGLTGPAAVLHQPLGELLDDDAAHRTQAAVPDLPAGR
ncbi:hypothetical protein AB0H73_36140 [Streptomyces olivoreticuli]